MMYFKNLDEAKEYAKLELESTDFVMLSDVNIKDKDLWATYRQEIRNLYLNPVLEFNLPIKPQVNWITE